MSHTPGMDLVDHAERGYGHVRGISPYSAGVLALRGFAITRVTLQRPLPWLDGFAAIDRTLAAAGRPPDSLCSIELRSPTPHSFGGFGSFNDDYRAALDQRGLLVDGGENPVARTNVAPRLDPPDTTHLFAFGYTVPTDETDRPSFIVSGAGDLHDQADLRPESIVGGERSWVDSGQERAAVVLDELEGRLSALGLDWDDTDAVVVYSVEAVHNVLESVVLPRLGPAATGRGVHWYWAEPPIQGLLFEMDARGGVNEMAGE